MATDMTIRKVDNCTNATAATLLAADMATAALDPDKFKFAFPIQLGGGKVVIIWSYDST